MKTRASRPSDIRIPSLWKTSVWAVAFTVSAWAAGPDFNREIRPILSQHCFKCHGPDDATRKGGLRLDEREAAMGAGKSGAIAVVPGKSSASEIVKRILSADPDDVMPPPSTKQVLTSEQKELLKAWVDAGAAYTPHWAFVAPKPVSPPPVQDTSWPRNGVDTFVLARLEKEGLSPSPEADRMTWVRRVTQDLTGLPPTPEEADEFLADVSSDAHEKWVDRLLASPRYGERWARRWLDLARYADTNGYEKDRQRNIWPWRDWVVRAFNADMPFDRFTIEQIAGDLLPNATEEQRLATGFHRNTMLNEEGGIDPLEFRFHTMTDRVATTGTAWLGLTVGCAQCHTHKYDPIQHREYYGLMAFLNNAEEPDMDLPAPGWEERHRANLAQAARMAAELPDRYPLETHRWQTPMPKAVAAAGGSTGKVLDDGSVLFAGPSPDKETYTLTLETDWTGINLLRLETLTDDALPSKGPGRVKHGNFVLSELTVIAEPRDGSQPGRPVKLVSATADVEQSGHGVAGAIDGKPDTGWAVDVGQGKLNTPHTAVFWFESPVGFPGGTRFVVRMEQLMGSQHIIGRPRLSVGAPVPETPDVVARRRQIVEQRFGAWLAEQRSRLTPWTPLRPVRAVSNLPLLIVQPDDSVFASGDVSKSDTYELAFKPGVRGITAVRLEALPDDRLPRRGPGTAYYEGPKGDFFMGEFQLRADGKAVAFSRATQSYGRNGFGAEATAALAIDGDPQTGWSTAGREGQAHEAVFVCKDTLDVVETLDLKMLFGRHYACSLGRFRISVTTQPGGAEAADIPAERAALLRKKDAELTDTERQTLREQFLLGLPEFAEARRKIEELRRPPSHLTTLVLRERPPENPRPTFLHRRGEYLQPGERVAPAVIAAVAPFPASFPTNRLGLARWLVSRDNPLTARVTVNRQWQAFFGRGLVRTMDDFGYQGESPTHPELLDWLATGFMQDGWSLKRLHKRIVLSATYRQSSRATAESMARDPDNRLLGRGPHGRLEAEIIRDSALAAAGMLSPKMGGPGVYPPQPAGVMEAAWGGSSWPTSDGEDRHRRSLYTFTKRTAPFALSNTFDAPTGESCIARRDVSNTALQALTLLNDVFFVEVSRAMGRKLAAMPGGEEERIRFAFRRCLTREPDAAEMKTLVGFVRTQRGRFGSGELDAKAMTGTEGPEAADRAAWAALVRALLNLDETITKG